MVLIKLGVNNFFHHSILITVENYRISSLKNYASLFGHLMTVFYARIDFNIANIFVIILSTLINILFTVY